MSEENQVPFEKNDPAGQQPFEVPPASGGQADSGPSSANRSAADAGWQEVGRQFQALGDTLAQTLRAAWENEETQRTVHEMSTGLKSMVEKVDKAIEESANSPRGQQIRSDAEKAAEALRTAGEQTVQEVRPQLINALQQVNAELQKLINRMEQNQPGGTGSSGETGGSWSTATSNDTTSTQEAAEQPNDYNPT